MKIGLVKNHTLLKGINEFLSVHFMFLNRFVWSLVREICTLALGNSEFPEIRCSESHTLHFTRPARVREVLNFPRFSAFSPEMHKIRYTAYMYMKL